jgi:hypothetical protein
MLSSGQPETVLQHYRAADASIWAEHQLVAIPGWLREDRNAKLDREGHLALIKEPRSPTIKKNKAKRGNIYCGVGMSKLL